MILNIKQYRETFQPSKSLRTVERMVSDGNLPSNHYVYKFRDYVIEIRSLNDNAQLYVDAITEFHSKNNKTVEFCAELSIKYNIEINRLIKLLAL